MENAETKNKEGFNIDYKFLITIFLSLCILIFLLTPVLNINIDGGDPLLINYASIIFGGSVAIEEGNSILLHPDPIAICSFILPFISLFIFIIAQFVNKKAKNALCYISIVSSFLAFIFFSMMSYLVLSFNQELETIPGFDGVSATTATYIFFTIICFIVNILISSYIERERRLFTTKEIAEISMMVALAVVLDKIKIQVGTSGGSINASALPLMILSIRVGFIKGVFASSILFGLITNILDGWGVQTLPFDYMIGFLGYALPGLFYYIFKKTCFKDSSKEIGNLILSFVLGSIFAFVIRMFGSGLSSWLIYGLTDIVEIIAFNYIYIGVSSITCLILSICLAPAVDKVNKIFPLKRDYQTF